MTKPVEAIEKNGSFLVVQCPCCHHTSNLPLHPSHPQRFTLHADGRVTPDFVCMHHIRPAGHDEPTYCEYTGPIVYRNP